MSDPPIGATIYGALNIISSLASLTSNHLILLLTIPSAILTFYNTKYSRLIILTILWITIAYHAYIMILAYQAMNSDVAAKTLAYSLLPAGWLLYWHLNSNVKKHYKENPIIQITE